MTIKQKRIMAVSIPLAVLLIATIIFGSVTSGFRNWGKSIQDIAADIPVAYDDSGNEMINGGGYPMPANMTFTSAFEGITPLAATSAVTLTASVTPSTAANKEVDWSVAWNNPSSSWANGKNVSSYVTATPSSDGSLTATVSCNAAFGEKVKITVTSRNNPDAKAECTVDYARRLTSTSLTVTNVGATFNMVFNSANTSLNLYAVSNPQAWVAQYGNNAVNNFTYGYESTYTVDNEVVSSKIEVKTSTELNTALTAQGLTSDCVNWYTFEKLSYVELIYRLGGYASLSGGMFLNTTNYNKLLAAFGVTTTTDFQLRITTAMKYGNTIESVYNCHFNHASAGLAVEKIELNSGTLVV